MGIDLSLLPIYSEDQEIVFAYTVLELHRRSDLWSAVRALPTMPVPTEFITLLSLEGRVEEEEEQWHHGNTQEDANGHPLTCVRVRDLMALADHHGVQENYQNRAAWAYLSHLPDDTRVALYWW